MTTWIVDLQDRVGQRVMPDAPCPQDRRFRKVRADFFRQALRRAQLQVMDGEALASRFPRLLDSVRSAANLTNTEAEDAVRGYLINGAGDRGGEAVSHFGGSLRAIEQAWLRRHALRRPTAAQTFVLYAERLSHHARRYNRNIVVRSSCLDAAMRQAERRNPEWSVLMCIDAYPGPYIA